jgi:chromosome segregation ATPase
MYVHKLEISGLRSIGSIHFEIPPDKSAGWHVVLGDNGAGKSSFVRALALVLSGPTEHMLFGKTGLHGCGTAAIKQVY